MCPYGMGIGMLAPDDVLSSLIKEKLGVEVEPAKITSFVLENWRILAPLVHHIHDMGVANKKEAD